MTLPRRTSRGITVDGARYRWLVTPVSEFTLRLIVERDGGQGQRLVLTREQVFGTSRVPPITPRYVGASIRHALRAGWRPQAPGADLCAPSATVSTARHESMVAQLQLDLRGLLERAAQWLAARASGQTSERLVEQLAVAMKLGSKA